VHRPFAELWQADGEREQGDSNKNRPSDGSVGCRGRSFVLVAGEAGFGSRQFPLNPPANYSKDSPAMEAEAAGIRRLSLNG
jgi:hypothetical protein